MFKRPAPRVRQYDGDTPDAPRQPYPKADQGNLLGEPEPKHEALRSVPYRMWVATLACIHCSRPGPSQAAHADTSGAKGMGRKVGDDQVYPLCADRYRAFGCHSGISGNGTGPWFTKPQKHALEARYVEQTQRKAFEAGAWPKGWPDPEWRKA